MEAQDVIRALGLRPLPQEGGYFTETFRSPTGSAIYYLVTREAFSALHRLPQDELFHFYAGDPVEMVQIRADGRLERILIGNDVVNGQRPQVLAPGGVWQGTRLVGEGRWALLGCTVTPPFRYEDFEISSREELIRSFPDHRELISRYTHF